MPRNKIAPSKTGGNSQRALDERLYGPGITTGPGSACIITGEPAEYTGGPTLAAHGGGPQLLPRLNQLPNSPPPQLLQPLRLTAARASNDKIQIFFMIVSFALLRWGSESAGGKKTSCGPSSSRRSALVAARQL
jgi:hypothetical protein